MPNRYVNSRFWEDRYVSDLNPSDKLVFLYLLTNAQTNIAGVYEFNEGLASMYTGLTRETLLNSIEKFTDDRKVFYIEGYIVMRNFIRHQSLNPSVKKGIVKELDKLPARIRKLYEINDDGLWFDARELAGKGGGSVELLTDKIDKLWIKMDASKTLPNDAKRSTFNRVKRQ